MSTIRQRIRGIGIRCIPWNRWKGEIEELPISSQTLFRKNGMSIDIWEINLKSEGYLFPDEDLLEVLKDEGNLYRGKIDTIGEEGADFGLVPDYFGEEDYKDLGKI